MKTKMSVSDAGVALVKRHEGFRSNVYKDVAGYETVGYGHKLRAGESFTTGLTEEQATELLKADLHEAENAVNARVTVPLTQNQFDALVDFTFNLGSGNLESSNLLAKLNKRQYSAVPGELLKWVYAGGNVVAGLVARRQDEAKLWESAA
jgi:lysozyme